MYFKIYCPMNYCRKLELSLCRMIKHLPLVGLGFFVCFSFSFLFYFFEAQMKKLSNCT